MKQSLKDMFNLVERVTVMTYPYIRKYMELYNTKQYRE